MSPHHSRRRPHAAARSGFSLVELMAVVAIISLLIALLLPAIQSVRTQARVAEVTVEIKSLETGIANFKTEFGIDPPSSIVLYEAATGDPSWEQDTSNPQRLIRSRSTIRKLWPQFNFSMPRDLNGNSNMTDVFVLNGAECLVFFLGGIDTIGGSTTWVANGFSKNPRDPFERGSGSRIGPFTEFDIDRFMDIDGDGVAEFNDKFIAAADRPYLYVSSYEGRGYDPLDSDLDNDGVPELVMQVDTTGDGSADTTVRSVYMQRDSDFATEGNSDEVPWNKTSFQIISAGLDGEYGSTGVWSNDNGFQEKDTPNPNSRVDPLNAANDNVTNFSGGQMQ